MQPVRNSFWKVGDFRRSLFQCFVWPDTDFNNKFVLSLIELALRQYYIQTAIVSPDSPFQRYNLRDHKMETEELLTQNGARKKVKSDLQRENNSDDGFQFPKKVANIDTQTVQLTPSL